MNHVTTERLCVGGLEFRFTPALSWPEGPLYDFYSAFLDGPPLPIPECDVITVRSHSGIPPLPERTGLVEDGTALSWYVSGSDRVAEKVLPAVSSEPCWRIVFHSADGTVDIYYGEAYLAGEDLDEKNPLAVPRFPVDQIMAIDSLASRRGVLVHTAGIRCGGRGFICAGVSGAGKTTMSRLLAADESFEILTDDRAVLRLEGDGARLYGTPWTGEGQHATPGTAPLAALFFLKQDSEVKAARLSPAEAVERLMPVSSVPWYSGPLMGPTLDTLEAIVGRTPAYDLHFTKTAATADLVREIITGP